MVEKRLAIFFVCLAFVVLMAVFLQPIANTLAAVLYTGNTADTNFDEIRTAQYGDIILDAMTKNHVETIDELFIISNAPTREDYETAVRAVESLVRAGRLVRVEDGHAYNGTAYRRWRVK